MTNSSYHRDYTKGGKTGSLGEWQNFAGWHSQNGESYISVLLNVPYDADPEGMRPALAETGTIMDWVFDTYTIAPALDTTQPITEVRVAYSTQTDTVMLYPADNMMTLLPAAGGAALTEPVFNVPDELAAPIRQGDVVGTVTLTIQGEVIGTADLIAGSDVSRNQVLYTLSRVSLFFKHILQSRHCADALRRWLLWNIYCRPRPARLTQDTLSRIYRRVYPCWM